MDSNSIFENHNLNTNHINSQEKDSSDDDLLSNNHMIENNSNKFSTESILKNCLTYEQLKNNITKPFSFHKNNFNKLNLYYSDNQIKWALQKLRSHLFPVDNLFMQNIFSYYINLNPDEPNLIKQTFYQVKKNS